MKLKFTFAWILWFAGTALIVASWLGAVRIAIGWAGFGLALAGTIIARIGPQD
jgi:hypothetical protein